MKLFSFLALGISVISAEESEKSVHDVLLEMLSDMPELELEPLDLNPKPLESVLLEPHKKPRSKSLKRTAKPAAKKPPIKAPVKKPTQRPISANRAEHLEGVGTKSDRLWRHQTQMDEMRANVQAQANTVNGKGNLQCLICNSQSYEDCYKNARIETCYGGACFIEVRYQGHRPSQVQAGCQQKTACINNMKQNFWQEDGQVHWIENPNVHQCKLFSEGKNLNSVCHNCCFSNYCTKGWQPNTLADWLKLPGYSEVDHMIMFDQFGRPPSAWSKEDYNPNTRNRNIVPVGRQKKPTMRNILNPPTGTPTTQKPRTIRKPRVTPKPRVTQKPRTTKKPVNQAMRFSLNVDKDGNVNQSYGKSTVDHKSRIASILNLDLGNSKKEKPTKAPIRVIDISSMKKPAGRPAGTAKPATTASGAKKGPWAHLPPWKQRALKRIRDQRLAAKAKSAEEN